MTGMKSNDSRPEEKPKVKPFSIMRADELFNLPESKEEFLVEGLIPVGGLNILSGKPKDGKSCLARQLAVDVAQGNEFLGRPTMQTGVLYFALEESKCQLQRALKAAEMRPGDPLYTWCDKVNASQPYLLAMIEATLDQHQGIEFVVIDTLLKLARIKDTNAYMDSQNGLEPWHNLAVSRNITILGLHHNRKAVSEDSASSSNMSGSTAIAANANNIIEIYRQRANDASSPRILRMNEYRYGEELQPTILSFDSETQRYSVGGTLSDSENGAADDARRELEQIITAYVGKNPGCVQEEIIKSIPGRSNRTKDVFYSLVNGEPPILERTGAGKRGDPFKYFLGEIQEESAA